MVVLRKRSHAHKYVTNPMTQVRHGERWDMAVTRIAIEFFGICCWRKDVRQVSFEVVRTTSGAHLEISYVMYLSWAGPGAPYHWQK